MMVDVSVIIPVHNGGSKMKKTINKILKQKGLDFEVLLINNYSNDNSLEVCKMYADKDSRVRVFDIYDRGTSMARKKGIEEARGNYIVFSDQDDLYVSNYSLYNMYNHIIEEKVDIVQFNHYTQLLFLRKNRKNLIEGNYSRDEIISKEMYGLLSSGKSSFSVQVWNKIYKTELLKEIANHINIELYFAEDQYLNLLAFSHADSIAFVNKSYYCWFFGGYSSSKEATLRLFEDYEKIRPFEYYLANNVLEVNDLIHSLSMESIYMFRHVIINMIYDGYEIKEILNTISKIEQYNFIQYAKKYILDNHLSNYSELDFLISDYSSEEYYEYIKHNLPKKSLKSKIMRFVSKICL